MTVSSCLPSLYVGSFLMEPEINHLTGRYCRISLVKLSGKHYFFSLYLTLHIVIACRFFDTVSHHIVLTPYPFQSSNSVINPVEA